MKSGIFLWSSKCAKSSIFSKTFITFQNNLQWASLVLWDIIEWRNLDVEEEFGMGIEESICASPGESGFV